MTLPMPERLGASDARVAIIEPGGPTLSYAGLDRLADRVAAQLRNRGLEPGGRVGLCLRRSADTVAAMLGILRAGCAYVPVDPRAPMSRMATIHAHGAVDTAFVDEQMAAPYAEAMSAADHRIPLQVIRPQTAGGALAAWAEGSSDAATIRATTARSAPELACLLYTSGTTGAPKGWMMTRGAIAAHAAWARQTLSVTRDDVFANHAQFNFGMSLFDIYASLGAGARLVLVPDDIRQRGRLVADLWAAERVSIWFSGPAILSLIADVEDLQTRDLSALRVVAFAGEVFSLPRLNQLRRRLPTPQFFNFYGSTEANVAAFYPVPRGADLEERPPIGRPCAHYTARIVGESGEPITPGEIGELQLRGAGLTAGYWQQPGMGTTADGWFRTGDRAIELPGGDLRFAGRIGRMIKLRGYRVEPGEIESRLSQHPQIREVGVVPHEGKNGLELVAHVSTADGQRIPVVQLKQFCATTLPAYMIPGRFEFHDALPKTSSGKIDVQALRAGAGVA